MQRSFERRLKRSQIGRFKSMADFDWAWPKKINRKKVAAALGLDFLEEAANVLVVANQGLAVAQVFIVKGDAFSLPKDVQLTLGFDSGSTVSGQLALRDLPRLVREASFVEIDAEPMVDVDRTETAP